MLLKRCPVMAPSVEGKTFRYYWLHSLAAEVADSFDVRNVEEENQGQHRVTFSTHGPSSLSVSWAPGC